MFTERGALSTQFYFCEVLDLRCPCGWLVWQPLLASGIWGHRMHLVSLISLKTKRDLVPGP